MDSSAATFGHLDDDGYGNLLPDNLGGIIGCYGEHSSNKEKVTQSRSYQYRR
jgi:hypothetical protein